MGGKLLSPLRRKTRHMFRRLSWIIGILFAFIGGIVLAGMIVTAPELAGPGIVTNSDGLTPDSNAAASGFPNFVLWMVTTTMCFGVGFMVIRIAGWLIEGLMPHRRIRKRIGLQPQRPSPTKAPPVSQRGL